MVDKEPSLQHLLITLSVAKEHLDGLGTFFCTVIDGLDDEKRNATVEVAAKIERVLAPLSPIHRFLVYGLLLSKSTDEEFLPMLHQWIKESVKGN